MQQLTEGPRSALTAAQVKAILHGPDLVVSGGCDLLDSSDGWLADISANLVTGTVSHDVTLQVHGTCSVALDMALDWGRVRLRPWLTCWQGDNPDVRAQFYLGVYLLTIPERVYNDDDTSGAEPYQVSGFDKLMVLNQQITAAVSVAAGDGLLAKVRSLIAGKGETKIAIDSAGDTKKSASAQTWLPDGQTTLLAVINDLLKQAGYEGLWCDHLGYYRARPYVAPAGRAVEYTFDATDVMLTIVGPQRTATVDITTTPNVWLFLTNDPNNPLSSTDRNQSSGSSSIDARGGLEVTSVQVVQAADQASLDAQLAAAKAKDMAVADQYELTTGCFPLAGHEDCYLVIDPKLGGQVKVIGQKWTVALTADDETAHTWSRAA